MDTSKLTRIQKAKIETIHEFASKPFELFIADLMDEEFTAKWIFNLMKQKNPDSLALKLAYFLSSSRYIICREKCSELLCKLLTDDDDSCTCCKLSLPTQSSTKHTLLDCISLEEESRFIMSELCKTIFKLGASLIPSNNWPELLPFCYQCVADSSSSNYLLKVSTFLIFEKLAKHMIDETVFPCVKDLHPILRNTLNDDTLNLRLRTAATKSAITFIQSMPSSNKKERFQDLLAGVISTLTDSLGEGKEEEESAQYMLRFLIDLAKNDPRFLRMQLVVVVGSILDIAEDEKLEGKTRRLAVEFLITLVEARERAPGMMRRLPIFVSRCFTMLLNLLLDIKDDPAWHSAETQYDDTGMSSNYHVGLNCLRRFSAALGGKSIAHIAIEQLSVYLAAPEWEKRHAALFALARIAKACSKEMIKNLEQVVNMALNCFHDPHPRVRFAASAAISQLFGDFSQHLQEQYHNQVFLALAKAMDDFQNPRIQASVAEALTNFSSSDDIPETLIPHLDSIVNKLIVLVQNGKRMVQLEALNALWNVAESVKEHFQTYYDTVMPHLKAVLRNTDFESNLILHAATMECISFVGFAGGKEKFRETAEQVMDVIISIQGLQAKGGDSPTNYLLRACTRICDCLGHDFLPYMSAVMPFLIQCAQLETAMTIYEHTEKMTACSMLRRYADTLKEDFYPWIPQVVAVLVPLLKSYTQNEVRKHAVRAMPVLLRSAKLAVEKGIEQGGTESYFIKLSDYIIESLVEALHEEPMTEVCALMLNRLNDCLQICEPLLNEGQLGHIVDEIKHIITESSNRKKELMERAKLEDFDAEEAELQREENLEEDYILVNVCSILSTLINTFKAAFTPYFDELSSYLIPLWGKDKTVQERNTAMLIIVYLVKECPEAALRYCDVFLHLLLDASNDENPAVRQNAIYALGLYAEYGGSVLKPFVVTEAISRINVVTTHFRAREPENEAVYDNAVSTLCKMCQFHRESIDSVQIIPIWLNCLPIKRDLHEAKYVHDQLCAFVERLDKELIGPNYQYIPKIISIFAEVLCSEKDVVTANRMCDALRHLHQMLPPTTFESALSYLLPQHQMELKSILLLE